MQVAAPPVVAGDPLPRQCGMIAGREIYGLARAGSQIVLGRHSPWRGDDNWSAEMDRFVGLVATVTSLDGVDEAGCPGVRVNVDGGQWFWRLRDAQLAGAPMGGVVVAPPYGGVVVAPPGGGVVVAPGYGGVVVAPPAAGIPNWCGMVAGGETYGPIRVSSTVILGMHTPWNGDANWSGEMSRWVGLRTQVVEIAGVDSAGCPGVRVAADGQRYFWRIRDMRM